MAPKRQKKAGTFTTEEVRKMLESAHSSSSSEDERESPKQDWNFERDSPKRDSDAAQQTSSPVKVSNPCEVNENKSCGTVDDITQQDVPANHASSIPCQTNENTRKSCGTEDDITQQDVPANHASPVVDNGIGSTFLTVGLNESFSLDISTLSDSLMEVVEDFISNTCQADDLQTSELPKDSIPETSLNDLDMPGSSHPLASENVTTEPPQDTIPEPPPNNNDDPDYMPVSSDPSDSENVMPEPSEKEKRQRRKKPAPEEWKMNIPKNKRLKGLSHTSRRGHAKEEQTLGDACTSSFCKKSNLRHCDKFAETERKNIHENFWKEMTSWNERRTFVRTQVTSVPKKQKKTENGRRDNSFNYFLKTKDGMILQVCKKMFCTTIGVSERTVGDWLNSGSTTQSSVVDSPTTNTPSTCYPTQKISDADNLYLKDWLLRVPCVDSHYCRKVPAYKDKRFLEPGTKIRDLYGEYSKHAAQEKKRVVGFTVFNKMFTSLNFSTFIPRKDQCDTCIAAKMGNIPAEQHGVHLENKDKARAMKDVDKERGKADATISVWTMDTQSVILCPQSKASALYYRTKLQVHNFTFFNLCNKDGYCYVWDETNGNLTSEIFGYIQYIHFKKLVETNREIKEIIIWSDGCGYQNKNSYLSNIYFVLAQETGVRITQKYLVSGHTNMECDAVHSTIERNMVTDIFCPRELVIIMCTARRNPHPYIVKELLFTDFKKLPQTFFTSIRPGKKAGDPTVQMVTMLCYLPDGSVQYKLGYDNHAQFTPLPVRIKELDRNNPVEWVTMFTHPLPITQRKYMDLQAMKKVMPAGVHPFYDGLRYQ